jgi:hypothetical protein
MPKQTYGLTETGRRELAHMLADNLSDSVLVYLILGWEAKVDDAGHIEIDGRYTKTGNPVTRQFSGEEFIPID